MLGELLLKSPSWDKGNNNNDNFLIVPHLFDEKQHSNLGQLCSELFCYQSIVFGSVLSKLTVRHQGVTDFLWCGSTTLHLAVN